MILITTNFKLVLAIIIVQLFCAGVECFSVIGKTKSEEHKKEKPHHHHEKEVINSLKSNCDPCPGAIKCVPKIQCPAHVRMKPHEKPQICDLPTGGIGFCCLTGQNHTAKQPALRNLGHIHVSHTIVEEGRVKFARLHKNSPSTGGIGRHQPEFFHNIVFHSAPEDISHNFQISNSAVEEILTSQVLKDKQHIPNEDFETNSVDVDLQSTPLRHHCPVRRFCASENPKYRTFDGSCNNPVPHRSLWGAAGWPMERLLPPAYEDGIWTPRMHSVDGSPLLSAREVSRILLEDNNRPHSTYNLMLMQFGQFVAHDVTQSATVTLENGEPIQCCTPDGADILPRDRRHFACLPIPIEPHDKFYRTFNQGCLNFVRLSLAPNPECKLGYAKQRSKVTHYLDASPVYGSNEATARELRTFQGGKLRMFNDFGRDLLPTSSRDCGSNDPGRTCFKSGDGRTNQVISLVVIHVLLAREHNRIASILAQLNPHWTDATLYEETRRIVIAQLQHITYAEWLPLVIGEQQLDRFRLRSGIGDYSKDYNPEVNPAVTSEFSGAAFRFGHSTVDGRFHIHHENSVDEVIDLTDTMFNPGRLRKRMFLDDLTAAMMAQPMQSVDQSITHGLTRFLFRGGNPFGLDLAAINIQRGRDHALRPYNDYMEVSGNRRIQSFGQFHPNIARKLSSVYKHPDDIDLWIGGLIETAIENGIVGPTFADIIADQFARLRHGDRYFYEYGPDVNPGAFTVDQLREIRKASMSRIICDNLDHFSENEVPPFAFVQTHLRGNEPVECDSYQIPSVNFEAWKQR